MHVDFDIHSIEDLYTSPMYVRICFSVSVAFVLPCTHIELCDQLKDSVKILLRLIKILDDMF